MKNNPFAKIFKEAFNDDVLGKSLFLGRRESSSEPARVKEFLQELNRFFISSGVAPLNVRQYAVNERALVHYALFLRGYMRDAQKVLQNVEAKYTYDEDMVRLFEASSRYVVACNGKIKSEKRVYDDQAGYLFCKADLSNGIENAVLKKQSISLDPNRKNLILFMPFRIRHDELELKKWLYKNMRNSMDNTQVFGKNTDVYVAYFPIEKSRCSKICSTIKTIQNPQNYVETQDFDLVKRAFLPFIAPGIQINDDGKVVLAEKYDTKQLKENFSNLTFMSYCAGTADAHRVVTVMRKISEQLYSKADTKEALQNLFVVSYGFLPIQKYSDYSGVHFFSNEVDDNYKKEPFAKMNNPEMYEACKFRKTDTLPAKVSLMPDKRNFVVALKNDTSFTVVDHKERLVQVTDGEYGHSIVHVTGSRLGYDFGSQQFQTVLENAASGKRGAEVFYRRQYDAAAVHTSLIMSLLLGQKQQFV